MVVREPPDLFGGVSRHQLPQISPVSGVHGVKPVHEIKGNAECEVRNSEFQCRGRTGNAVNRDNASPSIPHSSFRTPHYAEGRRSPYSRPARRAWSAALSTR